MNLLVRIKKVHPNAVVPTYSTAGAAGFDLSLCEETTVLPERCSLIRTGLAFEIHEGFHMQILPRSGLSRDLPGYVANAPGLIDSDYRGEVKILFYNKGPHPLTFPAGMRIAQGVVMQNVACRFLVTEELTETDRGQGGFGSTGV